MSALKFEVLGPVRAFRGPTELALGPVRQRAVLVVLLLRSGSTCSMAEIIAAVWGHRPPRTCVGLVRTYVSRLRRVLGRDVIVSDAAGYRVQVGAGELDAARLEALLDRARQEDTEGRAPASIELGAALAGWHGTPLDEVPGPFAQAQRARLTAMCCDALEQSLTAELAAGPATAVLPRLRAAVTANPLRERLVGLLMTALYRSGRQIEALTEFRLLRGRLAATHGTSPGRAVTDLHDAVLRSAPELGAVRAATATDLSPTELWKLVEDASALAKAGRCEEAVSRMRHARVVAERVGQCEALAVIHTELAWIGYHRGRFAEGLAAACDALSVANQGEHRGHAGRALQVLGDLEIARGELDTAQEHLRGAHAAAVEIGAPHAAALALASLATVAHRRGDLAAAFGLHDQAAAELAGSDPAPVAVELALRSAQTYQAVGDRAAAESQLRSCLELAEYTGDLRDAARALSALARCLPAGSEAQLYQARAAAILLRLGGRDPLQDAGPAPAAAVPATG